MDHSLTRLALRCPSAGVHNSLETPGGACSFQRLESTNIAWLWPLFFSKPLSSFTSSPCPVTEQASFGQSPTGRPPIHTLLEITAIFKSTGRVEWSSWVTCAKPWSVPVLPKEKNHAGQWWCTPWVPALGNRGGRSLCKPGLQSDFQDSQSCYREKP